MRQIQGAGVLMLRYLILAVAVISVPTHAQDGTEIVSNRTPASAQKFLAASPPDGYRNINGLFIREGDLTSPDACTTRIEGKPGRVDTALNWTRSPIVSIPLGLNGAILKHQKIVQISAPLPAALAGLRVGDHILSVNGQVISSHDDFRLALSKQLYAGADATIVFARGGQTQTVVVPVMRAVAGERVSLTEPNPPLEPITINWSNVQAVESQSDGQGHWVVLNTPGDSRFRQKGLSYAVATIRDRVLAAAQYLKDACDKSKELGF